MLTGNQKILIAVGRKFRREPDIVNRTFGNRTQSNSVEPNRMPISKPIEQFEPNRTNPLDCVRRGSAAALNRTQSKQSNRLRSIVFGE